MGGKVSKEKQAQMEAEFTALDVNGDGILTFSELQDFLVKHSLSDEVLKKFDKNGDGQINMEEFKKFYLSLK